MAVTPPYEVCKCKVSRPYLWTLHATSVRTVTPRLLSGWTTFDASLQVNPSSLRARRADYYISFGHLTSCCVRSQRCHPFDWKKSIGCDTHRAHCLALVSVKFLYPMLIRYLLKAAAPVKLIKEGKRPIYIDGDFSALQETSVAPKRYRWHS